MNHDKSVVAVFDSPAKADMAFNAMAKGSIPTEKLSMLVNDSGMDHHFKVDPSKSKTAEGVGYGAVLGSLAAGLGVAAAGVISVAIPGSIFITGPLAVSLAAGAAGAAVGGLTGGLVGMGFPEDEVTLVEKEISEGSILVAAHNLSGEEKKYASKIFMDSGATRVH